MVAVDMPFVRAATFQLLISNRDQNKMATCFYNTETQQPEPLLTLWEAEAYPLLLQFVEKGNISPREFLKSIPLTMIHPPDEKTLINVNYPRDF
jgi:molybdopterin-guanine dinucleotide biosynthesis protein A